MGIELDVLVGHPEHDLLFVATQVARAAGLVQPGNAVGNFRSSADCGLKLSIGEVVSCDFFTGDVPLAPNSRRYHSHTALFNESSVYQMLLRGHAPSSEPFRKWVTEEVLPSIRKTGKYSAEDSQNPIALAIMDELKSLRGEIVGLRRRTFC